MAVRRGETIRLGTEKFRYDERCFGMAMSRAEVKRLGTELRGLDKARQRELLRR